MLKARYTTSGGRHPEVKLRMLQGIDRMYISSRQQAGNTVAEDNSMPHFTFGCRRAPRVCRRVRRAPRVLRCVPYMR